jgi:hypothetical protein
MSVMPPHARQATALPLQLGEFKLEVEGQTYHDADDTWDATWLVTSASCRAPGATVTLSETVLTSWSVRRFRDGLDELMRSSQGCALLAAEGPELAVCVGPSALAGQISVRVDITPNRERQGHWFSFDVDRANLPATIAQCGAILDEFPAREMADG